MAFSMWHNFHSHTKHSLHRQMRSRVSTCTCAAAHRLRVASMCRSRSGRPRLSSSSDWSPTDLVECHGGRSSERLDWGVHRADRGRPLRRTRPRRWNLHRTGTAAHRAWAYVLRTRRRALCWWTTAPGVAHWIDLPRASIDTSCIPPPRRHPVETTRMDQLGSRRGAQPQGRTDFSGAI